MNVNRLPAVVLMAGALTAPATAVADEAHRYPGQRPYGDPRLTPMLELADTYWTTRGYPPITGCQHPALDAADDLTDVDTAAAVARAWPASECRIVLDRSYVGRVLGAARRAYRGERYGRRLRLKRAPVQSICATIVHEYGHSRGLPHLLTGPMSNDPATKMPVECVQLSHKIIRRRKVT